MWFSRLFAGGIPRAAEHLRAGRLDEAEAICGRVLRRRPTDADAVALRGIVLHRRGKNEEGLAEIGRAIELKPGKSDYHFFRATVLTGMGRFGEAIGEYAKAAELGPNFIIYNEWGMLLQIQGRLAEAVGCYRKAIELSLDGPEAHHNLGTVMVTRGDWAEAERSFRRAILLRPNFAEAHAHLGALCRSQDRRGEALEAFACATKHNPMHALAHFNRGELLLGSGNLAEGWEEYEWRLRLPEYTGVVNLRTEKAWDGSALAGRTILVHSEQGLGDTIQFIRYVPMVVERGGVGCRVIVECQAALVPMFRDSPLFKEAGENLKLIRRGEAAGEFDVQIPMMSLARIFGTRVESIPTSVPYLMAQPERIARWREKLEAKRGLRVGIVWQGDKRNPSDRYRSIPFARFAAIGAVGGVRLISLQKGSAAEEVRAGLNGIVVEDLGSALDLDGAFLDTIAVMSSLDFVITCDSAIAHVAGAMGVRVWVALSKMADWRWMVEREDTPWYPTMRLYRQRELGSWEEVMERMARDLAGIVPERKRGIGISVEVDPGELIDRITILEIKAARIGEPAATEVRGRLAELVAARDRAIAPSMELSVLVDSLRQLNLQLWESEDGVRAFEREQDFGAGFIELARSIYHTNDRRTRVKQEINRLLGAGRGEEKHYTKYGVSAGSEGSVD